MNPRQFLRSMLLSVGLLALGAHAQMLQKPTFAILNLPSGVYLQMDVTGLSGSEEPVIDTVRVLMRDGITGSDDGLKQAKASLMVFWGKVAPAKPFETKITEAQIIRKLEIPYRSSCDKCTDTIRALRVDTISIASYASSALTRQIDPPHVNSLSLTPRNYCLVKYAAPTCLGEKDGCRDFYARQFVEMWKAKPYANILEPSPIRTLQYVTPWSQTTGTEDYAGIATPMAGNRGNWIDVLRTRLATVKLLKQPPATAREPAPTDLPVWNIPTGAVRYIYNRTASPDLKILENDERRIFGDLLKIGKTLEVSREARPTGCVPPVRDTTMGLFSWLVLSDSLTEGAIERAMILNNIPFGSTRTSAWKISGDTVWLDDGSTTIPLADLLALAQGTTGVHAGTTPDGIRLVRATDGFALVLDRAAEARIVGTNGRILSDWTRMEPGRHMLPRTAGGIAFAQIRADGLRTTLPIVR